MKNKIFNLIPAEAGVCTESWNYAGELRLDQEKNPKSQLQNSVMLMLVADALFLFNKYFQAFLPKEQHLFSHSNGDGSFKNTKSSSKE